MQDEIALAKSLSVTYGVRYCWQADVADRNNFAPRAGFAYSPGGGKPPFAAARASSTSASPKM